MINDNAFRCSVAAHLPVEIYFIHLYNFNLDEVLPIFWNNSFHFYIADKCKSTQGILNLFKAIMLLLSILLTSLFLCIIQYIHAK